MRGFSSRVNRSPSLWQSPLVSIRRAFPLRVCVGWVDISAGVTFDSKVLFADLASTTLSAAEQPISPSAAATARELQWKINRGIENLDDLFAFVAAELPRFDELHVVSSLARVAELGYKHEAAEVSHSSLDALVDAAVALLDGGLLQPASVARLATAVATLYVGRKVAPPSLLKGLAMEAARHAADWSAIDAAMLAQAFARLQCKEPVVELISGASQRSAGFGTQALVNVIWAAATVRAPFNAHVAELVEEAAGRGSRLHPQGIANIIWALGTMRQRQQQALESLLPHVSHRAPHLSCQGLANTLWGLAVLRPKHGGAAGWLEEDAVVRLSVQSMRRIEGFEPSELAALARAATMYANVKTVSGDFGPLLVAIVDEALRKRDNLAPRHLAGLVWALARQRCRDAGPPTLLAAEAIRKVGDFKAEEVGSFLWSFASLRLRNEPLLACLAERLRVLELDDGVPFRVLSSLAWSHAVLRAQNASLLSGGLGDAAARRVRYGTNQEVANMAWAIVLLGKPPSNILHALANEVTFRRGFSSQEVANAAWAFATAGLSRSPSASGGNSGTDGGHIFDGLSRDFLACVTKPLAAKGRGRDWVGLVDALHRSGFRGPGQTASLSDTHGNLVSESKVCSEVVSAFEEAIYEPAARHLAAVTHESAAIGDASATARATDAPFEASSRGGGGEALKALRRFAVSLDLGSLGTTHTHAWLRHAGLAQALPASDADGSATATTSWEARARSEVASRCPPEAAGAGRPPHQRDVAVWLDYDVIVRHAGVEEHLREFGRVVTFSMNVENSELHPIFVGHSRAGHAERAALVEALQGIRAAERRLQRRFLGASTVSTSSGGVSHGVGDGRSSSRCEGDSLNTTEGNGLPEGYVRIFAAHTPCISCLAVFAQFVGLLPGVSLEVAFQDGRLQSAGTGICCN